jgi:hypothetical protein
MEVSGKITMVTYVFLFRDLWGVNVAPPPPLNVGFASGFLPPLQALVSGAVHGSLAIVA